MVSNVVGTTTTATTDSTRDFSSGDILGSDRIVSVLNLILAIQQRTEHKVEALGSAVLSLQMQLESGEVQTPTKSQQQQETDGTATRAAAGAGPPLAAVKLITSTNSGPMLGGEGQEGAKIALQSSICSPSGSEPSVQPTASKRPRRPSFRHSVISQGDGSTTVTEGVIMLEDDIGAASPWQGDLQQRCWLNDPRLEKTGVGRLGSYVMGLETNDEIDRAATENEDPLERGGPFMLDPHGAVRVAFDFLSFLALMYDVITLPIILVWDVPVTGFLYVGMWANILFWYTDMFVNFRTGFYRHGDLVMKPSKVALHYAKTWFIPDLVVLVCNTLIVLSGSNDSSESSFMLFRATKTTRLLRIFGFVRMLRISDLMVRLLDRYWGSQIMPLLELPGLLLFLSVVNHLIGCGWAAVGAFAPSDTSFRWVDSPISSRSEEPFHSQSVFFQWSTAVHWSLTQMTPGSMSVQPENSLERVFNIVCLLLGTIFFGSIVSRLSVKLAQYHENRRKSARAVSALTKYLRQAEVGTPLIVMACEQAQERMKINEEAASLDAKVFKLLPDTVQMSLHYEMYRKHLVHPLLRWWDAVDNTAVRLACHRAVKGLVLMDSDRLFHVNSSATSVYVLVRGTLVYKQDPANSGHVTEKSEVAVPTDKLIAEACLWAKWTHVGTMESTQGRNEVMSFNLDALKSFAEGSELCALTFNTFAAAFCRHLARSTAMLPTDVDLRCASFYEVLPVLPMEFQKVIGLAAVKRLTKPKSRALCAEMDEGKCMVTFSSDNVVERIVVVHVVKLFREDGRFLVHIMRKAGKQNTLACVLPGVKLLAGEDPLDAADRILRGWLAPFAEQAELNGDLRTAERTTKPNTAGGYVSTYQRIFHQALINSEVAETLVAPYAQIPALELSHQYVSFEDPCVLVKPAVKTESEGVHMSASASQTSSNTVADTMCMSWDVSICAWITEEDFQALSTDSGSKKLAAHINELTIGSELTKEAVMKWEEANHNFDMMESDVYSGGSQTCRRTTF